MKDITTLFNEASQWKHIPNADILHVDIHEQVMRHYDAKRALRKTYPISSALNGIGSKENSFMTPPGWHQIVERYGDTLPVGAGFKGRRYFIHTDKLKDSVQTIDIVLTRILRLSGLEQDLNKGAGMDSYERYIYIHGTLHEKDLGAAASNGCIRMGNNDIIELFNQLKLTACLVYIEA